MTDPTPAPSSSDRIAALADPYNYLLRRIVEHQEANRRQDDLLVLHPELWTEYITHSVGYRSYQYAADWQANTVMGYQYVGPSTATRYLVAQYRRTVQP